MRKTERLRIRMLDVDRDLSMIQLLHAPYGIDRTLTVVPCAHFE
jgi:hypothetical protein